MAIVNKLTSIFPGFGDPSTYVTLVAQALPNTATTPFVLTGFNNFVRAGKIRIKSTAAGTSAITAIVITGTDGSNVVQLVPSGGTNPASQLFDFEYDFMSDFNLTTITINITAGAGTNSTIDLEVAGNS